MKIFICLLAAVCACNATLSSLLGAFSGGSSAVASSGGSQVTHNGIAPPAHGASSAGYGGNHGGGHGGPNHGQGHGGGAGPAPQVIKIILKQGQGYSSVGGYGDGHSYGAGYASGHSYGSSGKAEIFKVITQSVPVLDHGYSGGFASSGAHSGGGSQLNAILPQILEIILQDQARTGGGGHGSGRYGTGGYGKGGKRFGGAGGNSNLNRQLIAHYGLKGSGTAKRIYGKANKYYSSGRVVQKGVLKEKHVGKL